MAAANTPTRASRRARAHTRSRDAPSARAWSNSPAGTAWTAAAVNATTMGSARMRLGDHDALDRVDQVQAAERRAAEEEQREHDAHEDWGEAEAGVRDREPGAAAAEGLQPEQQAQGQADHQREQGGPQGHLEGHLEDLQQRGIRVGQEVDGPVEAVEEELHLPVSWTYTSRPSVSR